MQLRSDIVLDLLDCMGSDQSVIGAMKTMNSVPLPHESDTGRIEYLMQHRHGTPFEHNAISLCVSAPIFVWREWHRHRIGFSYNEESARYKQLDPVFFIPNRGRPMIKTPDKWAPSRPKFLTLDEAADLEIIGDPEEYYQKIVQDMLTGYKDEYARYQRQLDRQLDPGLARDNLPVGIYTTCWVTCNLRSALAFLSLRTHEPAAKYISYPLWEIQLGARRLEEEIAAIFPLSYAAFNKFGRMSP